MAMMALSVAVSADTEKVARQAIQAQYDRMNRATMHKDIKVLEQVFSPNGVLREGEGQKLAVSKLLTQIKALFPHTTVLSAQTHIVAIKADGDTYITTAVWKGVSKFNATENNADVDTKPHSVTQKFQDTWKKTSNGWQIILRVIE
jgi:hypothetical protein